MPSIWSVGDIHGQFHQLDALLGALPRGPDDITVFLGDYIDRGDASADVVRRVLAEYDAAPERTHLLWGNHEDMAAHFFGLPHASGREYDNPRFWLENGGVETLVSYEVPYRERTTAPCPAELARLLTLLQPFWRTPVDHPLARQGYLWVHAGVPPGTLPEAARIEDLLWIREPFIDAADVAVAGQVVIYGHTPTRDGAPRIGLGKIGIDTGATQGGPLTALELPARCIWQATRQGAVHRRQIPTGL